jgi:hypothetical protein
MNVYRYLTENKFSQTLETKFVFKKKRNEMQVGKVLKMSQTVWKVLTLHIQIDSNSNNKKDQSGEKLTPSLM